jgi:GTP cyclohydrolase I
MGTFNEKIVQEAIYNLLVGIGEDPNREGLVETPSRVARMYKELCAKSIPEEKTTYLDKNFSSGKNELMIIQDIPLYSFCEHHIMPFHGKVHIGYNLDGKIIGLSKIYREVEYLSGGLHVQEDLNGKIFESFISSYEGIKLIVLIEAEHLCVAMRGIKKENSKFITIRKTENISADELDYFLKIVR